MRKVAGPEEPLEEHFMTQMQASMLVCLESSSHPHPNDRYTSFSDWNSHKENATRHSLVHDDPVHPPASLAGTDLLSLPQDMRIVPAQLDNDPTCLASNPNDQILNDFPMMFQTEFNVDQGLC